MSDSNLTETKEFFESPIPQISCEKILINKCCLILLRQTLEGAYKYIEDALNGKIAEAFIGKEEKLRRIYYMRASADILCTINDIEIALSFGEFSYAYRCIKCNPPDIKG